MPPIVDSRLDGVQRKMLSVTSESIRTKFSVEPGSRAGRVIERALELSGVSRQELAYALGYANQSAVSRWISGLENPSLEKLMSDAAPVAFRQGLAIAIGEVQQGISVQVVMTADLVTRRTA